MSGTFNQRYDFFLSCSVFLSVFPPSFGALERLSPHYCAPEAGALGGRLVRLTVEPALCAMCLTKESIADQ